jgi:hypothetical protein
MKAGYQTTDDLFKKDDHALLQVPGVGRKGINLIRALRIEFKK